MSTQRSISIALGVTEAAVSKWAARGCPVHLGPAAVRAWRAANMRPRRHRQRQHAAGGTDPSAEILHELRQLAAAVDLALAAGVPPDADVVMRLRLAMRCTPPPARPSVPLPPAVWHHLCADVLAAFEALAADAGGAPDDLLGAEHAPPLTDTEAAEMGDFYWSVAAGEVAITPAPGC